MWTKKAYSYFVVLLSIAMGSYAIYKNPSITESHRRFLVMKEDMEKIAKNGGIVLSATETDKYGVADLSVKFIAGSLSDEVRERNANTLSGLGWSPISGTKSGYCKDGILYSSYFPEETYDGRKILAMNFRYTAQTIDICHGKDQKHIDR
jgi:hypothetical protein